MVFGEIQKVGERAYEFDCLRFCKCLTSSSAISRPPSQLSSFSGDPAMSGDLFAAVEEGLAVVVVAASYSFLSSRKSRWMRSDEFIDINIAGVFEFLRWNRRRLVAGNSYFGFGVLSSSSAPYPYPYDSRETSFVCCLTSYSSGNATRKDFRELRPDISRLSEFGEHPAIDDGSRL